MSKAPAAKTTNNVIAKTDDGGEDGGHDEYECEAFAIYHEGVAMQLQWTKRHHTTMMAPPSSSTPSSSPTPMPMSSSQPPPALRLCAVNDDLLLLLTADEHLYASRALDKTTLQLELVRNEVHDMDYCRHSRQLFLVASTGVVLVQELSATTHYRPQPMGWQTLSFDPLELSEEGIRIARVCCTVQGVIFVTRSGELYVLGTCGDVFSAETQPKHMRLFEDGRELIDLCAGDEFFVMLIKRPYDERDDVLGLCGGGGGGSGSSSSKSAKLRSGPSTLLPYLPAPSPSPLLARLNRQQTCEVEFTLDDTPPPEKPEMNSNSSMRSYSSKSSSHAEQDREANVRLILKQGYALLNTQVHTFGACNNGLLGTGDHIKRNTLNNLQRLDAVGICSIATGREHTLARSLDGRLYHWGHNGRQQLSNAKDLADLSAPTELKLDSSDWDEMQRSVLASCCGDFHSVLLNAREEVYDKQQKLLQIPRDFLTLQMGDAAYHSMPLLLAAGGYTLLNYRQFQRHFHSNFINLRLQMRQMLKYHHAQQMLQIFQMKSNSMVFRLMQPVCQGYQRMLYLLAALLHSLERFYRGDYENPADVLFIKHYRACIELFEAYTKAYSDIVSIDGFNEVAKVIASQGYTSIMPDQRDERDLARIFQQPFQAFAYITQFLEQLLKSRHEFTEHLLAWKTFVEQHRIDLELAENTRDFWEKNERNIKIRHFRLKHRRVILTSTAVPLKMSNTSWSMATNTFILFSDCLLQMSGSSQLQIYPLTVMWLKIESDTGLQITTPERTFSLIARSHMHMMLWHDQLETSIMCALGRPRDEAKLANVRTTTYIFGRQHAKYAGVHAYGRWFNGQLHGNCYLEYPDGRFYFGQMRHGEIEGYGKMVLPSSGMYEGNFRAGRFHGHGTYELKDNEVYEGNFRDGLFHGHGTMRSNYYTYMGEYQANVRCGYGVLDNMLSGEKYMGMFVDNKRAGAGICITMNGNYFEGNFVNDELTGIGLAVFDNDYYYEGELCMNGPQGKGAYYMPIGVAESEDSGIHDGDEFANRQMVGTVLSGQLAGNWGKVRVVSGSMEINQKFPKYPKSIGDLVLDNAFKWRSLFDNFEEEIYGNLKFHAASATAKKSHSHTSMLNGGNHGMLHASTKQLWGRIAVYMTTQRERERTQHEQSADGNCQQQPLHSYFGKNISMGFNSSFDKLSLKSSSSLLNTSNNTSARSLANGISARHSHSQETLCDTELMDSDLVNGYGFGGYQEENGFNSVLSARFGNWANDSTAPPSLHSSVDSALNLSCSFNNNNNSVGSTGAMDIVPHFGITSLGEQDVSAIREYLQQAFKDRHHPLAQLNQRIINSFYSSYGCWKVKPSPILAKQAMHEWESISRRVYAFVRKMFPALPEDYCVLEASREVVSHITLLYPIILSEGIYSTLFVLYANKYSSKDEIYRQNLLHAEKLKDTDLADCLGLESALLPIVCNACFMQAIQTLKELQEKYSPKAMLTVIELCMQQITDAHKMAENETRMIIGADSMMPLTLFLVLRAAVPHLGAELALLDDLTGGANFQFEMNGMAGYCYTTLKAAYEHITTKPLNKT